jgi:hypothetical protein
VAPWTTPAAERDPAAEEVVRSWLPTAVPGTGDVRWDDGRGTALLDPAGVQVAELWSAGSTVAFAATQTGRFLGPDGAEPADGPVRLGLAGLVTVADAGVSGGVVVSDRLGLTRSRTRR